MGLYSQATRPALDALGQHLCLRISLPQAGKGSATLSMAYAAAVFADSCLKAMAGQSGVFTAAPLACM